MAAAAASGFSIGNKCEPSIIITRPLAASEGNKLPWASLNQDALDYINPSNTNCC